MLARFILGRSGDCRFFEANRSFQYRSNQFIKSNQKENLTKQPHTNLFHRMAGDFGVMSNNNITLACIINCTL